MRFVIPRVLTAAVLLGLAATGTACTGDAPIVEDQAMTALSAEAREALSPGADLLAPARYVMEAYRGGVDIAFADARVENDYGYGHIPGAVHVPYYDPLPAMGKLPRDRLVVVYCECPHAEAVQTAEALLDNGFTRVKVIDEGLAGWLEEGGTLEASESGG